MGNKKKDEAPAEVEPLSSMVAAEPENDAILDAAAGLDDDEAQPEQQMPEMTDPKWSDFVMTQFEDDETIEGCPTVDGLRRVAEKLLGPLVASRTSVIEAPNLLTNGGRATVEHLVAIAWDHDRTDIREFSDAADVYAGNTDPAFAAFATATAATRAEGRALRKALRLRRVVTAEETCTVPIEDSGIDSKIDRAQKRFIDVLCRRNGINVLKYINAGNNKYKSINDIDSRTAQKMVKFLSDCQNDRSKIADDWKGYDPDWSKE